MVAKLIVNGLYAIPVGFVNVFLIDTPEGCTLIDTGVAGSADVILGAIRNLRKQASDVRHILLTHAHPDHIGGLAALKRATGADAYMHPLDIPIATGKMGFRPLKPAPGFMTGILFRMVIRPGATVEGAPIEHPVSDGEVLPIAGGLVAIHTPGHCAGQLAFLWQQHGGVLFAADACSNVRSLSYSLGYEDLEEGKRSLRKLAQFDFEVACFGHGNAIMKDANAQFKRKWS